MLSIIVKFILPVFVVMVWTTANGYPVNELEIEKSTSGESLKLELLTHPLEEGSDIVLTLLDNKAPDVGFEENPDDLELAEVNIFRPVFRYRVAVSKKVKGPPQF